MAVLGKLLFYRRDGAGLSDLLRHQDEQGVRDAVERLPDAVFSTDLDDAIAERVVKQLRVEPLKLLVGEAKANVSEITLEVRDVFHETVRIKGLRATKTIPFTGDQILWECRPNPYDLNPPHGEISGNRIVVGIDVSEHDAEQAATYIGNTIAVIEKYIATQNSELAIFNDKLPVRVRPQVQARRARLGKAADLLKKLQS